MTGRGVRWAWTNTCLALGILGTCCAPNCSTIKCLTKNKQKICSFKYHQTSNMLLQNHTLNPLPLSIFLAIHLFSYPYFLYTTAVVLTFGTGAALPEPEQGVLLLGDDRDPVDRVEEALHCLPPYDPSLRWPAGDKPPFLYWKIRDFAHAYRSGITTPSVVSSPIGLNKSLFSSLPPLLHVCHLTFFLLHRLRSISLPVWKSGATRSLPCLCWFILMQMI